MFFSNSKYTIRFSPRNHDMMKTQIEISKRDGWDVDGVQRKNERKDKE